MNTLLKIIAFLLLTTSVHAETKDPGPHHKFTPTGRLINAAAMNVSDPHFVLPKNLLAGYSQILLHVYFDHAANGIITMTCRSMDNSRQRNLFIPSTCSVSGGACTMQGLDGTGGTWASDGALTGDTYFVVQINTRGYHDLRCSFNHGGVPTANDKMTVDGFLTAG